MAFRTRRRRRSSVAWLPNNGATQLLTCDDQASTIDGTLSVPGGEDAGCPVISIHGLTADFSAETSEILGNPAILADYTQSGYRLKRIVGKCFVAREVLSSTENFQPQAGLVLVAAGFMVLRADPTTGAPVSNLTLRNYDPAGLYTVRDPWIWRRTWMLGFGDVLPANGVEVTGYKNAWRAFPNGNAGYGSVLDGPHIDAKTARKIGPEERTFFVISARAAHGVFSTPDLGLEVMYTLDYRLLGVPVRMTNRGNASR